MPFFFCRSLTRVWFCIFVSQSAKKYGQKLMCCGGPYLPGMSTNVSNTSITISNYNAEEAARCTIHNNVKTRRGVISTDVVVSIVIISFIHLLIIIIHLYYFKNQN